MYGADRYDLVPDDRTGVLTAHTYSPSVISTLNEEGTASSGCTVYESQSYHPWGKSDTYRQDTLVQHGDTTLSSGSSRTRLSIRSEAPRSRFLRDWWLELVGCFFIVGSVMAIFVTAYTYQNHPLPDWPHWLTINSLIAIYIVVLKAAILLILAQGLSHLKWTWFAKSRPLNDLARYDNASRGPLGSIGLLWSLRGRNLISSVGALVVVVSVILDPMAQQLIRYWNCPQPIPGQNGTISRTNAYMALGAHAAAGISTIPASLRSAINGGVFVPSASTVSYVCPSGNCSFTNPYFTLGFTSQCDDVSSELEFQNVTRSWSYILQEQNPANVSQYTPMTIVQNTTMSNSSLPSGLGTSYNVAAPTLSNYMVMAFNLSSSVFELILGPPTIDPSTLGNLCAGLPQVDQPMSDRACRGYGAARCSIVPAIFAVTSNVVSGRLQENMTLQTTNFSITTAESTVNVNCLTDDQKKAFSHAGYILSRPQEPQWLPYNVSLYADSNNTLQYRDSNQNTTQAVKDSPSQLHISVQRSRTLFIK